MVTRRQFGAQQRNADRPQRTRKGVKILDLYNKEKDNSTVSESPFILNEEDIFKTHCSMNLGDLRDPVDGKSILKDPLLMKELAESKSVTFDGFRYEVREPFVPFSEFTQVTVIRE